MKQKTTTFIIAILVVFVFGLLVSVNIASAQQEKTPGQSKIEKKCGADGTLKNEQCTCSGGKSAFLKEEKKEGDKTVQTYECKCPSGQGAAKITRDGKEIEVCQLTNPAPGQLVSTDSFSKLLADIIQILLLFAGAITVIFLIIGGFRYITAVGSEEAMEKAKKTITGAVVGVVIIVMAFAIVSIINTLLTKPPGEQAKPIEASKEKTKETPKGQEPPPAGQEVQITTPAISEFTAGQPASVIFTATNCSPCEWEIKISTGAALPSFIRQTGKTGTITVAATDAEAGKSYNLSVKATNTATQKSATKDYTVTVKAKEPGITLEPFRFTPAKSGIINCTLSQACVLGTLSGGRPLFLVDYISVSGFAPHITADKKLTVTPNREGTFSLDMILSSGGGSEKISVLVRVQVVKF